MGDNWLGPPFTEPREWDFILSVVCPEVYAGKAHPPPEAITRGVTPPAPPEGPQNGLHVTQRESVESVLAEWRLAERLLTAAVDGDREALTRRVEQHRDDFQRLSAAHMMESIDNLQEAESRRAHATPSTPPFHEAARDAEAIAAEIWDTARSSDEDTPQTAANQRTAPKRTVPGPSAAGLD